VLSPPTGVWRGDDKLPADPLALIGHIRGIANWGDETEIGQTVFGVCGMISKSDTRICVRSRFKSKSA
jgi:hypothetical protein